MRDFLVRELDGRFQDTEFKFYGVFGVLRIEDEEMIPEEIFYELTFHKAAQFNITPLLKKICRILTLIDPNYKWSHKGVQEKHVPMSDFYRVDADLRRVVFGAKFTDNETNFEMVDQNGNKLPADYPMSINPGDTFYIIRTETNTGCVGLAQAKKTLRTM